MRLKKYLDTVGNGAGTIDQRYTRFGASIGVSLHCVRKWVNGQRRPSDVMKLKIQQVTGGKVTLEDLVKG